MTDDMQQIAAGLDRIFNGEAKGADRKIGFVLLTFNLGELDGGRVNYVGNSNRDDIKAALTELLARWNGAYQTPDAATKN